MDPARIGPAQERRRRWGGDVSKRSTGAVPATHKVYIGTIAKTKITLVGWFLFIYLWSTSFLTAEYE